MDAQVEQVVCDRCGARVDGPLPLTWSTSWGPDGATCSCESCTRQHLRSIEAKLDQEHW